jgi:hypothetical protein
VRTTDIAYAIGQMIDGKMHQTTIRFSPDLWDAMEEECNRLGVSVAQYLREAAVARLAHSAGLAGRPVYDTVFGDSPLAERSSDPIAGTLDDATALAAQGRLARARAREVRSHSEELRTRRAGAAR